MKFNMMRTVFFYMRKSVMNLTKILRQIKWFRFMVKLKSSLLHTENREGRGASSKNIS